MIDLFGYDAMELAHASFAATEYLCPANRHLVGR